MQTFREFLNEKEGKETEYDKFFKKKLEKYGVKSATELSGEDKKKFFDEVDAEWKGEEETEVDEKKVCNESNKKILDANFQIEINQIFNNENVETMLRIISKMENSRDKETLSKYMNLIKSVDIKSNEKVRLIVEK